VSEWTPTVRDGRRTAFRVAGCVLAAFAILPSLAFIVISLVTENPVEISHRFHYIGGFAGLSLIGVFSALFVFQPEHRAYFHALVLQAFSWLAAGLMGGDLISGFWITGPIGLVILIALHPEPRSLARLPGRVSVAMLTYSMLVAVPVWIYAVTMSELQHGPATDPHVAAHHWSGVAGSALAILGAAIAASVRGEGWVITAEIASIASVLWGLAGLLFSDLPGAPGSGWSWVAVAAGLGFWLLTQVEASRERTAS
jgi:hypothetical protein